MEKYELDKNYEDDEIDLVDLLKTIIKEKTLIIFTTILCILLAGSFAFYKNNKSYNYGVNITLSDETLSKIDQYNSMYKNINIDLNNIIEKSFYSSVNENSDTFTKIIDAKNKNYKLFIKTNSKKIKTIEKEIYKISNNDLKSINSNFNKNLLLKIELLESNFNEIKKETEILNKRITEIIKENFKNNSKENLKENLSIISPVLYIEYQAKIDSLSKVYSELIILKNISKNDNSFLNFSGENNIVLINPNSMVKINSKIIIAIGAFIGLFIGMFLAIIKEPLKNILIEIKKEK